MTGRVSSRAFARRRADPPPPPAVSVDHHNRVLRAAEKRALDLEDRLVDILTPILERAGEVAAGNFQRRAINHMAASLMQEFSEADGVTGQSTMVAIKPRPSEASALAEDGGQPADGMHVTLAYLGKTDGPLDEVANALARVAGAHAPLEGRVGGVGSFDDNGKGYPSILLPSVPGLHELRQHVAEALTSSGIAYGREHGFQPHLTVAYRPDRPEPPSTDAMGQPLHFDELLVVRGDAEVVPMPLVGAKPLTAAGELVQIPGAPGHAVRRADLDRVVGQARAWKLEDEIAAVAEEHQPDGGYGDTWWNADLARVYWVPGDWSTNEEIEAAEDAFLELDGVDEVETCDECGAPDGDGWTRLWARRDASSLTAASAEDFCLPLQLRGKTDPVRQAVAQTIMATSVEGAGIAFDVTNPFAEKVLAQSASQVTGISQTTQLDVMRIIRHSYEQGYSIPDTAKAIMAAMREAAPIRARLIARTELAGAVNGASLAATQIVAGATGDTYEKTWLTAPGAKYPRHDDYPDLNGQTVALDQPFDVGGSALQFPGDPDGPPDEVCNCRCALIYKSPEGEGEADAETPPPVLASACEAHAPEPEDGLDAVLAALTAASPAGWTAPAPEEVLPVGCDRPGASLIPRPEIAAPPAGDTVSVGPAPFVSEAARAKIDSLRLDQWPPEKGPVARRIFGARDNTVELYKHDGVWDDERAQVHAAIVEAHFEGKTPAEELRAWFTAGEGASGKTSARWLVDGKEVGLEDLEARADTIVVDPDRIKAMLPEYQQMRDAGDVFAASGVHEESSEIAKAIVEQARARGYSIVLDTTGSSSGFVAKIEGLAAQGYETSVTMVSAPTNEAIMRAIVRGDKTGRYVAIPALKAAHAGASRQLAVWMESPTVKAWRLYDTGGTSGTATLVATGGGGRQLVVYDQRLLDEILAKGSQ